MGNGAAYNRGNSEQSVGTPREFLDAVEARFGTIDFDLACTQDNCVAHNRMGWTPDDDSLSIDWKMFLIKTTAWLNPPFGNIQPWAAKCAGLKYRGGWTLFLVPYSAGANWWRDYVRGKSMIFALQPRIKFIGHTQSYPKDLALCAYGYGVRGEDNWRWR